jgi:hypothetical protein
MLERLRLRIERDPLRVAIYAWLAALVLIGIAGFVATTRAQELQPLSFTIGIDQPEDGTRYALLCERIDSVLLAKNGDVMFAGLPTWKSVKDSARSEQCPASQGNWIEIQTERLRNYQVRLRLVRYNAQGEVISTRSLHPYFWFENGRRARAPIILSV